MIFRFIMTHFVWLIQYESLYLLRNDYVIIFSITQSLRDFYVIPKTDWNRPKLICRILVENVMFGLVDLMNSRFMFSNLLKIFKDLENGKF